MIKITNNELMIYLIALSTAKINRSINLIKVALIVALGAKYEILAKMASYANSMV